MAKDKRIYGLSLHHLTAVIDQTAKDLKMVLKEVDHEESRKRGEKAIEDLADLKVRASKVCPQQLFVNLVLSDDSFKRVLKKRKAEDK